MCGRNGIIVIIDAISFRSKKDYFSYNDAFEGIVEHSKYEIKLFKIILRSNCGRLSFTNGRMYLLEKLEDYIEVKI